eukprot:SAG22_NODE_13303_length_411_cov_0.759615_1_plen_100_part_10
MQCHALLPHRFVAKGLVTDEATGARVAGQNGRSWRDIVKLKLKLKLKGGGAEEAAVAAPAAMPLLPGDGQDLWAYLSGANATSPRTEILHEAHRLGRLDG